MGDAKFCGRCGKAIDPGSKFCGVCGRSAGAGLGSLERRVVVAAPPAPRPMAPPSRSTHAATAPRRPAPPIRPGMPYGATSESVPGASGFDNRTQPASRPDAPETAAKAGTGLAYVAAGIAVFIVCVIIQAASGSSMFSTSYPADVSAVQDILINVTFYPGWIAAIGLVVTGVRSMVTSST